MLQIPLPQVLPTQLNLNQFSVLKFLSSFVAYSPYISWMIVGVISLFFFVLSAVLSYHWKKFEIDKLVIGQAAIIYFSVSTVLLVMMVISLTVYLNSF